METVGPPPADSELNFLTQWEDPAAGPRTRKAAVLSVLAHVAAIAILMVLPPDFLTQAPERPRVEVTRTVTPLVEPLTEFTQKQPNQGKPAKELDVASLQPRERIQTPKAAPSTTRQAARRPARIPMMPVDKPPVPAPMPEPPKIEALNRNLPQLNLPQAQVQPQIQTVEKPKMVLENVGAPPPVVPPEKRQVAIPNTSIEEAIRQNSRQAAPGGGLTVGDPGAGPGGIGEGLNLPPAPGVQGSALELKSDPMGVDFRPYLTQILATIRRNWYAVALDGASVRSAVSAGETSTGGRRIAPAGEVCR